MRRTGDQRSNIGVECKDESSVAGQMREPSVEQIQATSKDLAFSFFMASQSAMAEYRMVAQV
jgi:hypothetical protein